MRALLGGYATGTLTPEEQQLLFDAALQDQDLFDELAREQSLKEAFDDPAARRELLDVLDRPSWRDRFAGWLRWPIPVAAGVVAAAGIATVLILRSMAPHPVEVARTYQGELAPETVPQPAPKPEQAAPPMPAKKRSEPKVATVAPKQTAPAAQDRNQDFSRLIAPAPAAAGNQPRPSDQIAPAPAAQMDAQTSNTVESRKAAEPQPRGVIGGYPGAGLASARARTASALFDPNAAPRVRYTVQQQDATTRLAVTSTADGDLYLFRRDANGQWLPVTPGGMSMTANTASTTPALQIDDEAPLPHAMLLFSRIPLTNLAQSGAALTAEVERLRTTPPAGIAVVPVNLP